MWINAAIGFGGVLVLGLIGFVFAWRGIKRDHRQRMQERASGSEAHR
jgi:hypothetical protein